jgi:tRNA wybutosine-synthesizing protein 2
MKARRVPPDHLAALKEADWVEPKRRSYVRDGIAYVPVREGYPFDTVLPGRRPYAGRGFSMLGSIAVLQGKRPTEEEVREIERWKKPSGVIWIRSCRGVFRTPDVEVVSGSSSEVCHREMGIRYWLDPAQVMFSKGNRQEKARMMRVIRKGERVADMYAGIGYFSLPAARAGACVHAMELNPVAYRYLCRNLAENGMQERVVAECGDCRDLLSGWYDRILMGHFDSLDTFESAAGHLFPGGTIHFHTAGSGPPRVPDGHRDWLFPEAVRRVKKVAPHTWHYVMDLRMK